MVGARVGSGEVGSEVVGGTVEGVPVEGAVVVGSEVTGRAVVQPERPHDAGHAHVITSPNCASLQAPMPTRSLQLAATPASARPVLVWSTQPQSEIVVGSAVVSANVVSAGCADVELTQPARLHDAGHVHVMRSPSCASLQAPAPTRSVQLAATSDSMNPVSVWSRQPQEALVLAALVVVAAARVVAAAPEVDCIAASCIIASQFSVPLGTHTSPPSSIPPERHWEPSAQGVPSGTLVLSVRQLPKPVAEQNALHRDVSPVQSVVCPVAANRAQAAFPNAAWQSPR